MTRPAQRKLRIGWIVPTVGTFGAVREMVEVSNVLSQQDHRVTIYHPDGQPCKWLLCLANCRKLTALPFDALDVLIGIVDWQPALYADLLQAKVKVKAICLLGFSPSDQMAAALRGDIPPQEEAQRIIRDAMQRKFLLLADSSWQVAWVRQQTGYAAGPAFGGVNLTMFHPPAPQPQEDKIKIIYSGDPRPRKGTDTVEQAIKILKNKNIKNLEFDAYWGKKFKQPELVSFLQAGDIFLDGHRRAGWCNPVAEAMACGVVPVCTDIGAVQDFAKEGETACVVAVDDAEAMAAAALKLIDNPGLRQDLRQRGLQHIQKFSYEKIVPELEKILIERSHA